MDSRSPGTGTFHGALRHISDSIIGDLGEVEPQTVPLSATSRLNPLSSLQKMPILKGEATTVTELKVSNTGIIIVYLTEC